MAEQFFLRFGDREDQATVVVLDDEGRIVRRPESVLLAQAAALAGTLPVTVLLPATDLVTTLAEVPAASASRLRQMLPFSLEDDFAADVDELLFAAGERNDADRLAVAVIGRERLSHWLGLLRASGIDAKRICSEADAVPETPGAVTLFLEGRRILGRRPGHAPFCFDDIPLADLWQILRSEKEDAADLDEVVAFVDPATHEARASEIDAWRSAVRSVNLRELPDGCLPRLAANLVHQMGTNLLQGEFAPRSNVGVLLRPWRVAAGLLIGLLAFTVIGKGLEFWKLGRDDALLTSQASEICTRNFSSAQLTRCRAEVQRRLAENNQAASSGGFGFLSTLAAVATAGGEALAIQGINFRSQVLSLDVAVPSISYLDTFGQRLAEAGPYQLEVQSTSPQDGRVEARLQVVAVAQ